MPEFMLGGKEMWHRCYRSGQTKLQHRHPERFSIPVRWFIYAIPYNATVTEDNFQPDPTTQWVHVDIWFRIKMKPHYFAQEVADEDDAQLAMAKLQG
jgi:hypothetical protein